MSIGVFAVARNIFEHDFFSDEPFTEREAWIWLIREAAWKTRRVRVGKKLCSLTRGQLATSMRFMAGKWQWSEARVRRFLSRLKNDAMIDVVSDALATQITICNYNDYQRVSLPSDAANDADDDAAATQQRRSSDANKNTGKSISNTGKEESREERASAPEKEYVFEGEVLNLTAKSLQQWQKSFNLVLDMLAEIRVADAYYAAEGETDKSRVFFKVAQWLKKIHDRELAKRNSEREADERMQRLLLKMSPADERAAYERQQAEYAMFDARRAADAEAMH